MMFGLLTTKFLDFFSKQWGIILSLGAGLLVLARIKSYIGDNAVTRLQKRELQDALNRIKQNREFKDEYQEHVDGLDRASLIDIMRKNGELHITQD